MTPDGSVLDGPDLLTAVTDADIVLGAARGEGLADRLGAVLERLARAWRVHTYETEASNGLLDEIVKHAPRLGAAADQLREEHQSVAQELRRLRLRLVSEYGPTPAILENIEDLLTTMKNHDQTGASLIWEAYMNDVTGGD